MLVCPNVGRTIPPLLRTPVTKLPAGDAQNFGDRPSKLSTSGKCPRAHNTDCSGVYCFFYNTYVLMGSYNSYMNDMFYFLICC